MDADGEEHLCILINVKHKKRGQYYEYTNIQRPPTCQGLQGSQECFERHERSGHRLTSLRIG